MRRRSTADHALAVAPDAISFPLDYQRLIKNDTREFTSHIDGPSRKSLSTIVVVDVVVVKKVTEKR